MHTHAHTCTHMHSCTQNLTPPPSNVPRFRLSIAPTFLNLARYASYKRFHEVFAGHGEAVAGACLWGQVGIPNPEAAQIQTNLWLGSAGATTQCHYDTWVLGVLSLGPHAPSSAACARLCNSQQRYPIAPYPPTYCTTWPPPLPPPTPRLTVHPTSTLPAIRSPRRRCQPQPLQ